LACQSLPGRGRPWAAHKGRDSSRCGRQCARLPKEPAAHAKGFRTDACELLLKSARSTGDTRLLPNELLGKVRYLTRQARKDVHQSGVLGAPQGARAEPEELLLERSLLLRGGDVNLLPLNVYIPKRTLDVVGPELRLRCKLLSKIRLLSLAQVPKSCLA